MAKAVKTTMKPETSLLSRRSVVAGMGLSVGAGLALAQTKAAAPTTFWNAEYTAKKGDVSLAMYRKRTTAPKAG